MKKNKVIFFIFYVVVSPSHFETDMELIEENLKKHNDVYIVRCTGQLSSCTANPNHDNDKCIYCMKKFDMGMKILKFPKNRIISLKKRNIMATIPKFSNLFELKNFYYKDVDIGMAAASTVISEYSEHDLDLKKNQRYIEKKCLMSIFVYEEIKELMLKINPDVCYLFNGRFSEFMPIVRACRQEGIDFYTHDRAGVLNRYYLAKNALPHDIEYASKEMNEMWEKGLPNKVDIASQWYQDRRAAKDQGWMSFTKQQQRNYLPEGFSNKYKNIVIFNSSINEFVAMEGWKNPLYKDDNEGIYKIVNSLADDDSIRLYLRIHPHLIGKNNTQTRELREIEKLQSNKFCVIPAESKIDTYYLLEHSDVVLTFGSTVGIEANFWGKPSILAGRAYYESLGACYRPKSHNELIELLKTDLKPYNKLPALKHGYWQQMQGYPFKYFKQTKIFEGTYRGYNVVPYENIFSRINRVCSSNNYHPIKIISEIVSKLKERVNK